MEEFFADSVILVEGITDRILIQNIVEYYSDEINGPQIIEVLEVGGKHNFNKYAEFLENMGVPHHIIADRDYAKQLDGDEITDLFSVSHGKINDVLKDKKSLDADTLAEKIDILLQSKTEENIHDLEEVWQYIKQRKTVLNEDLTPDEEEQWNTYRQSLQSDNIHLLPYGELEDHLPSDYNNTEEIIELTKAETFDSWMAADKPRESQAIKQIVQQIMNV